ncbi:MAG: CvpA family protein [Candidatus Omnitrophica bacterium]|nr:CvpA family protein [Candidatus Omnitrophota bacterium]
MDSTLSVVRRFNWIDVFFIILLLRTLYVALKTGFIAEVFKLLGTLLAIYVSMHYYTALSDFLGSRFGLDKKLTVAFVDFMCFILLAIVFYLIGNLLSFTFAALIKSEAVPRLNKWGGFIVGMARALLLAGLFTFAFSISTIRYLHVKVAESYFGPRLIRVAPET